MSQALFNSPFDNLKNTQKKSSQNFGGNISPNDTQKNFPFGLNNDKKFSNSLEEELSTNNLEEKKSVSNNSSNDKKNTPLSQMQGTGVLSQFCFDENEHYDWKCMEEQIKNFPTEENSENQPLKISGKKLSEFTGKKGGYDMYGIKNSSPQGSNPTEGNDPEILTSQSNTESWATKLDFVEKKNSDNIRK